MTLMSDQDPGIVEVWSQEKRLEHMLWCCITFDILNHNQAWGHRRRDIQRSLSCKFDLCQNHENKKRERGSDHRPTIVEVENKLKGGESTLEGG